MKRKLASRCCVVGAGVALLAAALGLSAAETNGAPSAGSKKQPDRPREEKAPVSEKARGPVLDEGQRDLLREAMREYQEELRQLDDALRKAQRELIQAILAPSPDESQVREKADAAARIQTDLTVLRARVFAVVAPTLTPEQREQIESSPAALAMLMSNLGPATRPDRLNPGDHDRLRQRFERAESRKQSKP